MLLQERKFEVAEIIHQYKWLRSNGYPVRLATIAKLRKMYNRDKAYHCFIKYQYTLEGKDIVFLVDRMTNILPSEYDFFNQSFSLSHIHSKKWICENISVDDKRVLVACGWHGLLPLFLCHFSKPKEVVSVDIDPTCKEIVEKLTRYMPVKAITDDIFNIDYSDYDIIMNTSCEHIDFEKWLELIPKGKTVVLQSTNYEIPEHINPMKNLDEFVQRTKIDIKSKGTGVFTDKYKRFMIIGEKNGKNII